MKFTSPKSLVRSLGLLLVVVATVWGVLPPDARVQTLIFGRLRMPSHNCALIDEASGGFEHRAPVHLTAVRAFRQTTVPESIRNVKGAI